VAFIGHTAILAILAGTAGILFGTTPFGQAISRYWCRSNIFFLRVLTGVKTQVEGDENIPPGGCIIASKHQSDWDIGLRNLMMHYGPKELLIKTLWVCLHIKWFMEKHVIYLLS
jgi:1-acyl-sn-glycerol-3-phosphate acyltransferase